MRKRHIPTDWPQRDPRHYRFPIPNAVWEYQLKPIEFVLLSYLCYCHTCSKVVLTPVMIAKGIHKSVGTVKKYLPALIDAQLITAQRSINAVFLSANDQNFFTLPNEIFLLKLPPSAFMVYAYLLLIEDRRTHTCHPSYSTIVAATGISRNTVIKSIRVLLDKHLIAMECTSYFDGHGLKWNGNNLYTILPAQRAVDKFHQQQLDQLELATARQRVRKRQEKYDLRHPRAARTPPAPGASDQTSAP